MGMADALVWGMYRMGWRVGSHIFRCFCLGGKEVGRLVPRGVQEFFIVHLGCWGLRLFRVVSPGGPGSYRGLRAGWLGGRGVAGVCTAALVRLRRGI